MPFSLAFAKEEVSVGAAIGDYNIFDEGTYRYSAFAAKISYEVDPPHMAVGLKVDWESDQDSYYGNHWVFPADWYKDLDVTPLVMVHGHFITLEVGWPVYGFHYPDGYLRLGPEDLIFLTGSFCSDSPPVYGGMEIRIGVGTGERLLPTRTKLWFGVGGFMGGAFMGRVEQKVTQKFTVVVSGDLGLGMGLALGITKGSIKYFTLQHTVRPPQRSSSERSLVDAAGFGDNCEHWLGVLLDYGHADVRLRCS